MNTCVDYMYRDADNYKQYGQVIVAGELTEDQLQPWLIQGQFFIPQLVGLTPLQRGGLDLGRDHQWHELCELTPTTQPPTGKLTARSLRLRFRAANGKTAAISRRSR